MDRLPTRALKCLAIALAALAIAAYPAVSAACEGCPDPLVAWTWWIGAGGGVRDLGAAPARAVFAPRIGLSAVFLATQFGRYHLLLVGPWLGAETHLDGIVGDGGIELVMTPGEHHGGQAYGLRLGGGYGVDASGRAPQISLTLIGGVRALPSQIYGNDCRGEPPHLGFMLATGARLYATLRTSPAEGRGVSVVAGLEVEPSLFFTRTRIQWSREGGNGTCVIPQ